ncbi:hypothetical protein CCHR01_05428 [Colletotrichum chrysophilum]|uniref:Uncharacterized protein n=1 Tax=Colletotrichum chrysophilum TaxID=1836956 RepID=A0AAD9AUE3_9PEZI|nr:hypothetical protein CCHR01_05428 [Colletotrichum chrysophilum]
MQHSRPVRPPNPIRPKGPFRSQRPLIILSSLPEVLCWWSWWSWTEIYEYSAGRGSQSKGRGRGRSPVPLRADMPRPPKCHAADSDPKLRRQTAFTRHHHAQKMKH